MMTEADWAGWGLVSGLWPGMVENGLLALALFALLLGCTIILIAIFAATVE